MNNKQQTQAVVLLKILIFVTLITMSACAKFQTEKLTRTVESLPTETPIPTNTSTITPIPTYTSTSTITPKPTFKPPTATPTATPKAILISNTAYTDGGDEVSGCVLGIAQPRFILYADGQLIVYRNNRYWESLLSQNEITLLLQKIENTGILELGKVEEEYGWDELIVEGHTYHVSHLGSSEKAVAQAMKIVDQFQPTGQKYYVPESINWWVHPGGDAASWDEYLPKPIPETRKWPENLKSLSEFDMGFQYMSGEILPNILAQFDRFPSYQIFEEGDNSYITAICANFGY